MYVCCTHHYRDVMYSVFLPALLRPTLLNFGLDHSLLLVQNPFLLAQMLRVDIVHINVKQFSFSILRSAHRQHDMLLERISHFTRCCKCRGVLHNRYYRSEPGYRQPSTNLLLAYAYVTLFNYFSDAHPGIMCTSFHKNAKT